MPNQKPRCARAARLTDSPLEERLANLNRLLLMRHAKSDWNQPGLNDRQRPLNERGEKAANLMGNWLVQQNLIPDVILASPANRTQQTVELLVSAIRSAASIGKANQVGQPADQSSALQSSALQSSALQPTVEIQTVDCLYLAPPHSLLETIGQANPECRTVLLVAHNPGLEELLSFIDRQYHRFPTAAIADIQVTDLDWEVALSDPRQFVRQCQMATIWRPKELPSDQRESA